MIVLDASVLATSLVDNGPHGVVARRELRDAEAIVAPDLIDTEMVAVLRKHWLAGVLSDELLIRSAAHLREMDFVRVPTRHLVPRMVELRNNVTAYDACYVALAEQLDCELLTADARLAAAVGSRCSIRVLC